MDLYDLTQSQSFANAMLWLGYSAAFLATALIVVAFAYYGRGREADGASGTEGNWVMLFAAWRDSLIITVLYTSEAFLFRFSELMGLSDPTGVHAGFVIQPVASLCLHVAIFAIAILRVIALTQWLSARRVAAGTG